MTITQGHALAAERTGMRRAAAMSDQSVPRVATVAKRQEGVTCWESSSTFLESTYECLAEIGVKDENA